MSLKRILQQSYSRDRFERSESVLREYQRELGNRMSALQRFDFIIGYQLGAILESEGEMRLRDVLSKNYSIDRFDRGSAVLAEYQREIGRRMSKMQRFDFLIGYQLGAIQAMKKARAK